jgi:hypothetical protein
MESMQVKSIRQNENGRNARVPEISTQIHAFVFCKRQMCAAQLGDT